MSLLEHHTPEIAIMDDQHQVFAEVYVSEGRVVLTDPGRLDEAAGAFWNRIMDLADQHAQRRDNDRRGWPRRRSTDL